MWERRALAAVHSGQDGGTNIVPRWPQDYAAMDPFRYPGY